MKKAEIKTKETNASVEEFLNNLADDAQRADSLRLIEIFKTLTGEEPKMWGPAIIGFGSYLYVSPTTGRSVDWLIVGFSPRKANLTLYLMSAVANNPKLLERLGKHKTGKGCLYIKRLSDVDEAVLNDLIEYSVRHVRGS